MKENKKYKLIQGGGRFFIGLEDCVGVLSFDVLRVEFNPDLSTANVEVRIPSRFIHGFVSVEKSISWDSLSLLDGVVLKNIKSFVWETQRTIFMGKNAIDPISTTENVFVTIKVEARLEDKITLDNHAKK